MTFYVNSDFLEGATRWIKDIIKREEEIRYSNERETNLKSEIAWLEEEIRRVTKLKGRKNHKRHLRQLKYEIRQKELEMVFLPRRQERTAE